MTAMSITGGCLCGAVRFTIEADAPLGVRQCWCRVCQAIGAGTATVNAIFRREDVTIAGEPADFASTADSGTAMHRRFCPSCGIHLFSESETRPNLVIIRVGTFDDPEDAAPQSTIWTASAPSWAHLPDDLPATPGQPPPVG